MIATAFAVVAALISTLGAVFCGFAQLTHERTGPIAEAYWEIGTKVVYLALGLSVASGIAAVLL